jgi:hypothetical protein
LAVMILFKYFFLHICYDMKIGLKSYDIMLTPAILMEDWYFHSGKMFPALASNIKQAC